MNNFEKTNELVKKITRDYGSVQELGRLANDRRLYYMITTNNVEGLSAVMNSVKPTRTYLNTVQQTRIQTAIDRVYGNRGRSRFLRESGTSRNSFYKIIKGEQDATALLKYLKETQIL